MSTPSKKVDGKKGDGKGKAPEQQGKSSEASASNAATSSPPKEASLETKPKFLCGAAISVYQNSGDPNTNWAWFEKQKLAVARFRLRLSTGDLESLEEDGDTEEDDHTALQAVWKGLGPSRIVNGARIGKASDFWNRYEQDLQLAKDLGCNSIRISIEWGRLEPKMGQFSHAAIDRYNEIFDCIERLDLECNVTLHWFVHPKWFEDLGAFQKEDNIQFFVRFAKFAFEQFGKRSKLWATFNEPAVASMCGFITGNHPPGKILKFRAAGINLLNMLRSHTAVYKAIKAMPGGQDVMVGLVHNVWWMEPKRGGPFFAHVRLAVAFANKVWGNEYVMRYLRTGHYHYWNPLCRKEIEFTEPEGKPGCDFFGLNHYARAVADWKLMPAVKGGKGLADMGYPVYPPSLYRAISYASTLGVPVYIMENGMPRAKDDELREQWIEGAMQMVKRAVEDGYDVRGYMYWTLIDNFEWNFAWDLKFGLYEWLPNNNQIRRLRNGAQCIKKWYEKLPDQLGAILAGRKEPPGVKPEEERQKLERAAEEDWLRQEGWPDDMIQGLMCQDKDPLIAGVY